MNMELLKLLALSTALIAMATVAKAAGSDITKVEASGLLYARLSLCPKSTAGGVFRTLPASNVMHCASHCLRTERCERFSLSEDTAGSVLCHLGDSAVMVALQWTEGDCQTFATILSITTPPEFAQLEMKRMYNFKVGGLANLADPVTSKFSLTANDVTIGSNGAEFKGYQGSYLNTETPGFEQFLDYGTQHSFFVQLRHTMSSTFQQVYYKFRNCQGGTGHGNSFGKRASTNFFVINGFTSGSDYRQRNTASDALVPNNGKEYLVSLGFTFNETIVDSFNFNGSRAKVSYSNCANPGLLYNVEAFQCLAIGLAPGDDSACLNGTMRCLGMSTRVLRESEFAQLEAYCLK